MITKLKHKAEEGVVSLLTVIFFMIFISIIVVGFTTIVVADQRQTVDNDLSASALAAARSGVEDGKRILLYCLANPSAAGCATATTSHDCDTFKSPNAAYTLATSVLNIPLNANGEGATGGATAYQQYFTCLTVQTKTDTLKTTLNAGSDYIQQLKTVSAFADLNVTWESTSINLTNPTGPITATGWPTSLMWNASARYPVLQLQVIPYTAASLSDLDILEHQTKTVYLVPCSGTCPNLNGTAISTVDVRNGFDSSVELDAPPIIYASCTAGTTCSAALTGFGVYPAGTQFYVRATLLYASSVDLTLSTDDAAGATVQFDNVQPIIDVTGRANDVYKRVQTQVSSAPILPTNTALDSAAPICKIMTIVNTNGQYNCN